MAAKQLATNRRDKALSDHNYHAKHYQSDMTQELIYAEVKKQFKN